MSQLIPREVSLAEALVRGIIHPFHYSKSDNRLKPEALLPPPNQTEVSVLRLAYTEADFCKQHGRGLHANYLGLAVLAAAAVPVAARQPGADPVAVVASPLDAASQPVAAAVVTTADPGLPMHADLVYSAPMVKGQPSAAALKRAARYLVGPACTAYYADPQPEAEGWQGPPLRAPSVA